MGQQSEEEGAQHTSLGGPCVQCDGAGCVTADPYCLRSPGQKVQQPRFKVQGSCLFVTYTIIQGIISSEM